MKTEHSVAVRKYVAVFAGVYTAALMVAAILINKYGLSDTYNTLTLLLGTMAAGGLFVHHQNRTFLRMEYWRMVGACTAIDALLQLVIGLAAIGSEVADQVRLFTFLAATVTVVGMHAVFIMAMLSAPMLKNFLTDGT